MDIGTGWTPFPYQIVIKKHETSDPLFYEIKDGNVLVRLSNRTVCSRILKYWQTCPATRLYRLMPTDAKSTLEFFESFATNFDEVIYPVLFATDIGYCYRRVDFDTTPCLTPAFDELMNRTSNAPALMAWIGSLFDDRSERQQYLWIYGDGMNGKSSLAKFLQNIFGIGATSAQPPGKNDRFWSSQFLGKRLAILPDCNDYSFVNSGLFKSHTGDDFIACEEKNKGVYCVLPTWKFLILSNQKPSIEDEASAVRRAIYCEMAPITSPRIAAAAYQRILSAEAPGFINKCMDLYNEMAPEGGAIETDAAITKELTDAAEERWAFIANRHLSLYEEGTLDEVSYNQMPFVTRHYMRSVQKMESLSAGQYQGFLNYLKRKHGIRIHHVKIGSSGKDVYIKCDTRGGEHYADSVGNGRDESAKTGAKTVHYLHSNDKRVLKE